MTTDDHLPYLLWRVKRCTVGCFAFAKQRLSTSHYHISQFATTFDSRHQYQISSVQFSGQGVRSLECILSSSKGLGTRSLSAPK